MASESFKANHLADYYIKQNDELKEFIKAWALSWQYHSNFEIELFKDQAIILLKKYEDKINE